MPSNYYNYLCAGKCGKALMVNKYLVPTSLPPKAVVCNMCYNGLQKRQRYNLRHIHGLFVLLDFEYV